MTDLLRLLATTPLPLLAVSAASFYLAINTKETGQ